MSLASDSSDAPIQSAQFDSAAPLTLECGVTLPTLTIAYTTTGRLNASRTNTVLVCHAITGDQHLVGPHPVTGRPGWWTSMVGPGLPIDTRRFFVVCVNVLGGCMGTTGPASIDPACGSAWGLNFPGVTIRDMVQVQARLLDHLKIPDVLCVIGGSMGGMQALQWAVDYPKRVFSVIPIATAAHHSAQNIAFHEVGRQAIMVDPDWHGGDYLARKTRPSKGLAVARMAAHVTYLSESALHRKFGRLLQDRERISYGFDADFRIESYLRHQGFTFVDRFDANSYLYLSRAMDYFDLAAGHSSLTEAFRGTRSRFCLVSFTSDWLFPTAMSREIVRALNGVAANVSFVEVETDKGHDAFLLEEPELFETLSGFLDSMSRQRGEGS